MAGSGEARQFVLVPGAYHGGWCWNAVAQILEAEGHRVVAPTLSGLDPGYGGALDHIDLDRHVSDVVELVERRGLTSIDLVGWSYGGMVITGALARIPEAIRALVYLDAYLPADGESVASYLDADLQRTLDALVAAGAGVPAPDPREWGITDAVLLESVRSRLVPHPPRTLTQTLSAPEPWPAHIRYVYLLCRDYEGSGFGRFFEKASRDPRFRTAELRASHAAALTHPAEVARQLLAES